MLKSTVTRKLIPCGLLVCGGLSPAPVHAEPDTLSASWGRDVIDAIDNEAERSVLIDHWLTTRDWREMSPPQRVLALDNLNTGGTSANAFSVRWLGVISAPTPGSYTFARIGVPDAENDWMKVWIDGELVLDTSGTGFEPVAYVFSDQPAQIRVELSRNAGEGDWPISSAVLGWADGEGGVNRVPAESFQTQVRGRYGLTAVYYADPAFGTPFNERIDAAIDLIWDDEWDATVANDHVELRRELAAATCSIESLESIFATESERYTKEGGQHAGGYLGYAARNMSAGQREELALMLLARPDLLGQIDGYSLMELMWHVLPISDTLHADLLMVWAEQQPRYRTRIGSFPDWELDGYYSLNWDKLAHTGLALAGCWAGVTMKPDAVAYLLEQTGIARANGTANLNLIPILCFACKESGAQAIETVLAEINDQLSRDDLGGDARATWLAARALYTENCTPDTPNPLAARRDLELAFAAAETDQMAFWTLGEWASRMASMGDVDGLEALLSAVADRFSSESQVRSLQTWRSMSQDLADRYARGLDQDAMDRQREVIASLQARLERAITNHDAARQARYQQLLSQAQKGLEELEQGYASRWAGDARID